MSESSSQVHAIFSRIADRYDLFNALSSLGVHKRWLRYVVRQVQATPRTEMLDVAAGTGDVSFAVARSSPPANIVLSDFNADMLKVARRRLEEGEGQGVPIQLQVADGQALPFSDQSFDALTCAYGIRNMPDRPAALREAHRVLRPGGRYVVLEFSAPPNLVFRTLYHIYLKTVIPFIGGVLTGRRQDFVYLNDTIRAFPAQEEFAAMLCAAGFSQVAYRNLTGGIVAVHTAVR
jgi:demethylmenaquinone methyltransferase/2-methoxy-6-polyprenyl-1,4-benzoquinol methylase